MWAIAHFRPYFYGQRFILVTDHKPLWWLMELDKFIGKLAKWVRLLHVNDFEMVHCVGITNLDTYGLSRNLELRGLNGSCIC
jgi:hypothetical protein